MNFPITEPIFQFFYWLVNTAGLGGVLLLFLIAGVLFTAFRTLKWIADGNKAQESETYNFPTPKLLDED